ncbi:MAG: hypothetical protein J7J51_01470, partial [Candidatus Omnitrophica bacterium]|nr:hypothetical protein [Candidatus Omnitrophota bacterium]
MSKRPLIFALLISLFGHCLFLLIPRFDFIPPQLKEWKDVLVEVEIEKKRRTLQAARHTPQTTEQKTKETKARKQEIREKKKEKFITKRVPKVSKKPQFKRKKVGRPQAASHPEGPRRTSLRGRQAYGAGILQATRQKPQKAKFTEPREKKKIEKENYGGLPSIVKDNKALLRYQDRVKQRIEQCKKYPRWAKRQG